MNDYFKKMDLSLTPYSCAGSWLSVSRLDETHGVHPGGIYLRTNREVFEYAPLFRLELWKGGAPILFRERFVPGALRLETADGEAAELTFEGSDTIRFRSGSLGCRLYAAEGIVLAHAIRPRLCRFAWRGKSRCDSCLFRLETLSGESELHSRWDGMGMHDVVWVCEAPAQFAISETFLEPVEAEHSSFESCRKRQEAEFAAFAGSFPELERFGEERFHALYLNGSAQVSASGLIQRRCMLVSKHKMSGMWAWDHCFNALAMAKAQPELAFDQFMAMFDRQDGQGGIPDLLTPTVEIRVHVKPPVHGWIFSLMRRANPDFFRRGEVTREVYGVLCDWTRYWMEFRDVSGIGLPFYLHGKDSGWDNATLFLNPVPLASPDLAAYLVLQMELLADLAGELGRRSESAAWRESARRLFDRLFELSWDGETFHAVSPDGRRLSQTGDTLLVFMPLLLGERLPASVAAKLREGMFRPNRFRTGYGLASESVASGCYDPAGYWRGPIWAPSTFIAISGLIGCGAGEEALSLAGDYCRLCSEHGFYENFNAVTGEGNDERTLSWSVSIFLLLSEYWNNDSCEIREKR